MMSNNSDKPIYCKTTLNLFECKKMKKYSRGSHPKSLVVMNISHCRLALKCFTAYRRNDCKNLLP